MPRLRTSGLISLAWFLAAPLAAQAPPADLVFLNGTVYTVDPDRPRAGAVAVFGDRIVAVGTNSEIRSRIGRSTRIVDLEGRFVVPRLRRRSHAFRPGGGPSFGCEFASRSRRTRTQR